MFATQSDRPDTNMIVKETNPGPVRGCRLTKMWTNREETPLLSAETLLAPMIAIALCAHALHKALLAFNPLLNPIVKVT